MVGQVIAIAFKLLGALALFMYGMQLTSDGIQRAAGDRLQKTVNFMTKNRFIAVFTGVLVTILIQSSSATSVMVVSFVNAGLLNLVQAIGVMMGAHIGTTLTGWIIAAVGIQKFSIALLAVPLFGIGYFMTIAKKNNNTLVSYGEALMGFAMIFLGLEYLAKAIPDPSGDALLFLQDFSNRGWLAVLVCVAVGIIFTMLINASSATIAIVIGLAAKGIITFEMAAAITLGSNIGTTFDAFLVSLGANINGKRAAWAHILMNIFGTFIVLSLFKPFVQLVDFITPGAISASTSGAHIAMFHTMFNVVNTIVFLPLIRYYAQLLEYLLKPKAGLRGLDTLRYQQNQLLSSPELNIMKARKDIAELTRICEALFSRFRDALSSGQDWSDKEVDYFERNREYVNDFQEGTSKFLLDIAQQDISEKARDNIGVLLRVVTDLENIALRCCSLAALEARSSRKKLQLGKDEVQVLEPYTLLVLDFLQFVKPRMEKTLSSEDLSLAEDFERRVDDSRNELKKLARKRIRAGADVKTQLYFIDLVRHIEKVGDYAWSISINLRELK